MIDCDGAADVALHRSSAFLDQSLSGHVSSFLKQHDTDGDGFLEASDVCTSSTDDDGNSDSKEDRDDDYDDPESDDIQLDECHSEVQLVEWQRWRLGTAAVKLFI